MTAKTGRSASAGVTAALVLSIMAVVAGCGGATGAASGAASQPGTTPEASAPTVSAAPPSSDAPASAPAASAAPSVSTDEVDAIDACSLLTAAEVASALGVGTDRIQPMPGGALVPGIRTCFYRPPGVGNGPQLNVAVLASPDISRPASPSPVAELADVSGTWWFEAMTGDLKVEALSSSGVRLTFSYQDTSAGPPTDAALVFLVPLVRQALARLR